MPTHLFFTFILSALFSLPQWTMASSAIPDTLIMESILTGKEQIIKRNKFIRVKTLDGQKFKGKFSINEENQLKVGENLVNLEDIEEIKLGKISGSSSIIGPILLIGGGILGGIGLSIVSSVNQVDSGGGGGIEALGVLFIYAFLVLLGGLIFIVSIPLFIFGISLLLFPQFRTFKRDKWKFKMK